MSKCKLCILDMEHVDIVATEETTYSNHSDANVDAHDTTIDDDMICNVENEDDEEIADDVDDINNNNQNIFDEPTTTAASAPLSAAVVVVAQTSRHDVEDIEQQQTAVGETTDARAITVSNNATSFFDSFVYLAQDVEVATEASTCHAHHLVIVRMRCNIQKNNKQQRQYK